MVARLVGYRWEISGSFGDSRATCKPGFVATPEIARHQIQTCRAWNQQRPWCNNPASIIPLYDRWYFFPYVEGEAFDAGV